MEMQDGVSKKRRAGWGRLTAAWICSWGKCRGAASYGQVTALWVLLAWRLPVYLVPACLPACPALDNSPTYVAGSTYRTTVAVPASEGTGQGLLAGGWRKCLEHTLWAVAGSDGGGASQG